MNDESGLVYMQARWMDPSSGTFLSIDPLVAGLGDPQSHNAYAYPRNNPAADRESIGAGRGRLVLFPEPALVPIP